MQASTRTSAAASRKAAAPLLAAPRRLGLGSHAAASAAQRQPVSAAAQRQLQQQQQCTLRRARRVALAAVVDTGAAAAGTDESPLDDSPICSILTVRIDNVIDPRYTKLTVDVQNYSGLFRTVAWTLNGLGVRAHNANMQVDEDDFASQTYWLTDLQGNKLSDTTASNVQDSLQDFVETCMPSRSQPQEEWDTDSVFVSNKTHDKYTELLIKGEPEKPGFLLEIATVMAACGAEVHQAVIQGDRDFAPCCAQVATHDFAKKGRIFRFMLSEGGGEKLKPDRVSAILYTLDLVAGKGYQPMRLREIQWSARG